MIYQELANFLMLCFKLSLYKRTCVTEAIFNIFCNYALYLRSEDGLAS